MDMEDRVDRECHICGNNHSLGSGDWTLAGHLCANRADRPNEWQMDEYIRKALALEQQNAKLIEVAKNLIEAYNGEYYEACDFTSAISNVVEQAQQALAEVKGE